MSHELIDMFTTIIMQTTVSDIVNFQTWKVGWGESWRSGVVHRIDYNNSKPSSKSHHHTTPATMQPLYEASHKCGWRPFASSTHYYGYTYNAPLSDLANAPNAAESLYTTYS